MDGDDDQVRPRHSFTPLLYELRHVSVMTTVASRETHLKAIVIRRCQGDDSFVACQPLGFPFLEKKGNLTSFLVVVTDTCRNS